MRTPTDMPARWKSVLVALLVAAPVLVALPGCTDLATEPFSEFETDQFFQTEAEYLAAIVPVYAQLRNIQYAYHEITQISTDETIIPTRGTDWDDGGQWRRLHAHEWTTQEGYIANAWGDAYTGIARANFVLARLENPTTELESAPQFRAELRTLRAFFYYTLMDLYGNVPIVTAPVTDPDNPPANATREEVFEFIRTELMESIPDLPQPAPLFGRASQGFAHAILANMYINAAIFTEGDPNSFAQGSYNSCMDVTLDGETACQLAIDEADAILNSGSYELAPSYFDNFIVESHTSPEIIFGVGYAAIQNDGWVWPMRTLHYNLINPSPWNGWAVLAETYQSFDDADPRKQGFLTGQMYEGPDFGCIGSQCFSDESLDMVENRSEQPLTFDLEIPFTGAQEGDGVRLLKWEMDSDIVGGHMGNDLTLFRLGEIYLIKAEALWQQGNDGEALDLLNDLRARASESELAGVGDDDDLELAPLTSLSEDVFLQARLHELINELKRRQDLIRFGQFTAGTWEYKDVSDAYRALMPIPQGQIDANPNLNQNPGY